tara:strand:- start:1576 stop:2721 length:1146 start_codon:yes stop_codon:yes gene_type:complete
MEPPRDEKKTDKAGNEIVRVPLFVAATSPFTLVTFDEGDEPDYTLDQANNATYDRLKLCRTTTALDPQLSAMDQMAVIVSYTGDLLFPRLPEISEQQVLASANRLLLMLTFGGIAFDAVSPNDIGFGFIYGTGYFVAGGGAAGPNFQTLMALQYQDAGSADTLKLLQPRVRTSSEIHAAMRIGTPVVEGIPEISPTLFLNGLTYFRQGQLEPALVFLWSTCESLVGRLWDDHVIPTGIGIPNRKRFIDSNGWQAAQKVEVLFQIKLISEELYTKLSHARKARNALAHRATPPKIDDCKAAVLSAFELVSSIRSPRSGKNEFQALADHLAAAHDPIEQPIKPMYWREIPSVPGDEKWEGNYPRHTEIELVPISKLRNGDKAE